MVSSKIHNLCLSTFTTQTKSCPPTCHLFHFPDFPFDKDNYAFLTTYKDRDDGKENPIKFAISLFHLPMQAEPNDCYGFELTG
ncbi:hypothetical protein TIFTF001_013135 [Ficus carica]|uniref:Uncharacterized protein n=1 Tax=Ficus carica TaxID=3494 RepID=A0AA88A0C7_FICCA|nr:hypothetical protein TIFTF001_013135 [Ficus carica]